jgi:rSAM/selenodomain-associated transferase 1
MNKKRCVVLFARYPERGEIKSRLATVYDPDFITGLYQNFVNDILEMLQGRGLPFCIAFHPPGKENAMRRIFGKENAYIPQEGMDLGERMKNVFIRCFSKGFESVVIIGSDIPDLPGEMPEEALNSLEEQDVTIGPSGDGGYYLIGFTKETFTPAVFEGIAWGTDTVLGETLKILNAESRAVHTLPEWNDIDTPDDLREFMRRNERKGLSHSRTMSYLAETNFKEG